MADRVVNDSNQIWYSTEGEITKIGFTRSFLQQAMEECWHILPAAQRTKAKEPLLVLETNDGLTSILSPCAGSIIHFNDKARNFPDQLTEDDVVVQLSPAKKKVSEKPKRVTINVPLPPPQHPWAINPFENIAIERPLVAGNQQARPHLDARPEPQLNGLDADLDVFARMRLERERAELRARADIQMLQQQERMAAMAAQWRVDNRVDPPPQPPVAGPRVGVPAAPAIRNRGPR